ncbi:hypothetical protein JTB14_037650 [Gonioctena quinquepunctata]|nr:hypothetical protein JTB14_037650 [Gonioctena quinquepunctata]
MNFIWSKADMGLCFDEKVDELAKESINRGHPVKNKMSLEEDITQFKKKRKDDWTLSWKQYCGKSKTRDTLLQPNIPVKFWHKNSNYGRRSITIMSSLKFGHLWYSQHLNEIVILDSNSCETCNGTSDLDHIFFGRSRYQAQRERLCENF